MRCARGFVLGSRVAATATVDSIQSRFSTSSSSISAGSSANDNDDDDDDERSGGPAGREFFIMELFLSFLFVCQLAASNEIEKGRGCYFKQRKRGWAFLLSNSALESL